MAEPNRIHAGPNWLYPVPVQHLYELQKAEAVARESAMMLARTLVRIYRTTGEHATANHAAAALLKVGIVAANPPAELFPENKPDQPEKQA